VTGSVLKSSLEKIANVSWLSALRLLKVRVTELQFYQQIIEYIFSW
jgi:hypothetical protein